MEMGLLTRYAPFMELLSSMYPRPAPQLPLWTRHNPRGGLLVCHGDYRRQDNWGVPLRFQFLASAANSVSSVPVTARPQYFPPKDMLQSSARAQGRRLFCSKASWHIGKSESAKRVRSDFAVAINKHKMAMANDDREERVKALENLKEFAKKKGYCDNECHANDILRRVLSSLGKDQLRKHGDDRVVKSSLEVARLLLQNAPDEIRIKHEVELKPILERIRDFGGIADEVIILANDILAELSSTPK